MLSQDVAASTLLDLLNDTSGKVLLLNGEWGCGKTHIWRHEIEPSLIGQREPLTISLFGVDSKAGVKAALITASLIRRAKNVKKGKVKEAGRDVGALVIAGVRKALESFSGVDVLGAHIDATQLLEDGLVICIDDIERSSPSLTASEILGLASQLAETKNARVLLIANEDGLDKSRSEEFRTYKERSVFREVRLTADVDAAYDQLSTRQPNPDLRERLQALAPTVTGVFKSSGHANLRTLMRVTELLSEVSR